MHKNRSKYIVWAIMAMMLVLLFIQVRWIRYTVQFQEKVFKNSVDLALDKTISNLNNNRMMCNAMRQCMGCDSSRIDSFMVSGEIWKQIHASIDAELAVYDVDADYELFITRNLVDTLRSGPVRSVRRPAVCYAQSLREVLQTSGYELVVRFPDRTRFFLGTSGLMLISSVLLILLVLVLMMKLFRLYRDEVRFSENTRELINNVTHEFKTPMSSISLASNIIRKGTLSGGQEKIREYGDLIFRENQKLQQQVESLLDLAALEWESFEYRLQPEKLAELVKEALHSVHLLVEEKQGTITTDLSDEDNTILADRLHLTNAIVNILVNALKYSSGPPEIMVSSRGGHHTVSLAISDKGIGIPHKYQRYIFDKYFRVPQGDVHDTKGFGIGLSYVKSVVKAHGGKILVESEPGKGSTFTLVLPKTSAQHASQ